MGEIHQGLPGANICFTLWMLTLHVMGGQWHKNVYIGKTTQHDGVGAEAGVHPGAVAV